MIEIKMSPLNGATRLEFEIDGKHSTVIIVSGPAITESDLKNIATYIRMYGPDIHDAIAHCLSGA